MIIFSNPCTGKTEAIRRLNLRAYEINCRSFFEFYNSRNFEAQNLYIQEIIQAEPCSVLMAMYFDRGTMEKILNNVDNKRIIIVGFNIDYQSTIERSSKIRKEKDLEKFGNSRSEYIFNSPYWVSERVINYYFQEFLYYQKKYPQCTFIQLKPGEFLSDVIWKFLLQESGEMEKSKYSKEQLEKKFPLIF